MTVPVFRAVNAFIPPIAKLVSFDIQSGARAAVFGTNKELLLRVVAGKTRVCQPDGSRAVTYPQFGKEEWPSTAVQFMDFASGTLSRAPYVGARFESYRSEFDISLREHLKAVAPPKTTSSEIETVCELLELKPLMDTWYVALSNGQSRRAQLAAALLKRPRILVANEPFLGLDPHGREMLEHVFTKCIEIPIVLGLRGFEVPSYITQALYAGPNEVLTETSSVQLQLQADKAQSANSAALNYSKTTNSQQRVVGPQLAVDLRNLQITPPHGVKPLFRNLNFQARVNERVRIRGANGSGKSTLFSLITGDHPRSWDQDVRLFGRPREVGRDSYFSINQLIGQTSPEIHAVFPRRLTISQSIATGFRAYLASVPTKLNLNEQQQLESVLTQLGLSDKANLKFGEVDLGTQKLVLLGRALVKSPPLLLLDEAFSGMDEAQLSIAQRCISNYNGTVLAIAHEDRETPPCDREFHIPE